jgi:hypothetical protein
MVIRTGAIYLQLQRAHGFPLQWTVPLIPKKEPNPDETVKLTVGVLLPYHPLVDSKSRDPLVIMESDGPQRYMYMI